MSCDHLNLGKDDKVRKILQKHADGIFDEIVLYSNRVTKINRKSKPQQRILVITDKAIYNFTPGTVKARSFSIKQFFDNQTETVPISKRLSVHQSLKPQQRPETSVAQMKRRILLKQIHTISVSSMINEIVLHVPTEYDYLYRVANAKDIEEIVRVLHQSSEAIKHHIKIWEFKLDTLSKISDNSKSRTKGNETQDQYMLRKLKQWKKKYKIEKYDIKKCVEPPKKKKKTKKNDNISIQQRPPYIQPRAHSIAPITMQNSPHRTHRAATNFAGAAQPHRPSYFTRLTPNHSVWNNNNNMNQLQQQFPPPSNNAPLHRQVYSESFSTNPNYQMQVRQLGAMAFNQRHPQQIQPQQTKKKKRRHSESSCHSSCSCSSGSYTGSSYTTSESGSSYSDDDTATTAQTEEKDNEQSSVLISPSKTRLTPKNQSPIEEKQEEDVDQEEANHRHNLNVMRKRRQTSRSHNRYAQTQVIQSNFNTFVPIKKMPTKALPTISRPLPQNGNNNEWPQMNNINNNNNNNIYNNNQEIRVVSSILEAKELRVINKEAYLPDHLFWQVFQMTKEQFYALRTWKQKKLKRDTGFF